MPKGIKLIHESRSFPIDRPYYFREGSLLTNPPRTIWEFYKIGYGKVGVFFTETIAEEIRYSLNEREHNAGSMRIDKREKTTLGNSIENGVETSTKNFDETSGGDSSRLPRSLESLHVEGIE